MIGPYLMFDGNAKDAIDFYEKIFNGEGKNIMLYKDAPADPDFPISDEVKELVLYGEILIKGNKICFSDAIDEFTFGDTISLAIRCKTVEEVTELYNKLVEGGEIIMEISPQFYSPMYGWVKDRFGINWQIMAE